MKEVISIEFTRETKATTSLFGSAANTSDNAILLDIIVNDNIGRFRCQYLTKSAAMMYAQSMAFALHDPIASFDTLPRIERGRVAIGREHHLARADLSLRGGEHLQHAVIANAG